RQHVLELPLDWHRNRPDKLRAQRKRRNSSAWQSPGEKTRESTENEPNEVRGFVTHAAGTVPSDEMRLAVEKFPKKVEAASCRFAVRIQDSGAYSEPRYQLPILLRSANSDPITASTVKR